MQTLSAHEARVLGVLIEKAQTTPGQYPMTMNALINGCNQKSNRDPVMNFNEDQVFDAIDSLRQKKFVREVDMTGSRVAKYRHIARETISVDTNQLVVLAELMLRGPQTLGEIRGRANRMHPIENLDAAEAIIDSLMERDPPLIRKLSPPPGSRAALLEQLLAPGIHKVNVARDNTSAAESSTPYPAVSTPPPPAANDNQLEQRVKALEQQVAELAERLDNRAQ